MTGPADLVAPAGSPTHAPAVRVLHVMPSIARGYGGPVPALLGYLDASHAVGIATTVIAPHCAPDDLAWFQARLPPGVKIRTFAAIGLGHMKFSPGIIRFVRRAAGRYDAVDVHGVFNLVGSLAGRAALAAGVPLIVHPFGTLSRYTFAYRRGWAKRLYFRFIDRPTLRRASALQFTTDVERDEAQRPELGLPVAGMVAPPPWRPEGNRLTRTPRAHARTVLLLSRLHPVKAIEALLDAWPLVRARRHDARLVIAGDGEAGYVTSLRARVMRNNELPPDIVFAGFLDGLAKDRCFADADVFVLPSYHENFGIAAVEAIASGLPVVISPDVQLSAFVRAHGLGIVANRESGELADALVAALADDDLRRRSATLGPALVEQSFSPTAVGAQLLEMYRAALHRRA